MSTFIFIIPVVALVLVVLNNAYEPQIYFVGDHSIHIYYNSRPKGKVDNTPERKVKVINIS